MGKYYKPRGSYKRSYRSYKKRYVSPLYWAKKRNYKKTVTKSCKKLVKRKQNFKDKPIALTVDGVRTIFYNRIPKRGYMKITTTGDKPRYRIYRASLSNLKILAKRLDKGENFTVVANKEAKTQEYISMMNSLAVNAVDDISDIEEVADRKRVRN